MGLIDKIRTGRGLENSRSTKATDKTKTWIKNFTGYLSEQKAALKTVDKNPDSGPKRGKGKRNKIHTKWIEKEQLFVFTPRYGTKLVALKTEKDGSVDNQIHAESIEELSASIDILIEATKLGEMNDALAQAAARPRKAAAEAGPGNPSPKENSEPAQAPAAPASAPTPPTPAPASSGTSHRNRNRS